MKYDLYDMIDEKYQYGLTILRIHNKIKYRLLVKTLLILPVHNKIVINIIFLLINSMSIIILCSDFNYDEKEIRLSKYLNYLTPLGWVEKFHIDNTTYIIICIIFMFLCLIRTTYLIYIAVRIKKIHITQIYNIRVNKIIDIMNHIMYVLFAYIIQFLSFIIYIVIFPKKFVIQKDTSLNKNIDKIFMVLNLFFIIIYNIYNYVFIRLAFLQKKAIKKRFQMIAYGSKFHYLIFLQNLSILQALPRCLRGEAAKYWNISFSIFIIIFFSIIYFIYVKSFNYDNIINNIISFIGNICFVSLILELVLHFSELNYKNYKELIFFTFIKIMISFCLYYVLKIIYSKLMIREVKRELFNKDPNNFSFDGELINYILFLREIATNNDKIFLRAIKYFKMHKDNCQNKYCSCKVVKYACLDKQITLDKSLNYEKQQLIHFMDSIFIKMDFNQKFELAYILSEHFFFFKNNYIMAYSILKTFLRNNYKNLSLGKLLIIYHSLEKYINYVLRSKIEKIDFYKYTNDKSALGEEERELELKKYFNPMLKLKKITKLMILYSKEKNELIKHKQNFESSIKIDFNESDGEPQSINSQIFDQHFISQMLHYLRFEYNLTKDLKKLLFELKEFKKILSLEFLFKCILFIDYFWNAEIPQQLIDILYGFTSNKSLYSNIITSQIYDILTKKYNHENYTTKHYILLKYTHGLLISYISESLIRKLNLEKDNIKNKELDSLFIRDLAGPHNKAVNQFFITQQHFVDYNRKTHFFNNKRYLVPHLMNSSFQIGINKNILILCQSQIDEDNKSIIFLVNKNMEIISINQNFENRFNLSLPLIEEFKFEIKDLFDVSKDVITKKFNRELIKLKYIKQFIQLDPKEYILKSLFKSKNIKELYKFNDDIIFKNEQTDDLPNKNNDSEKNKLINRQVKQSFVKMIHKIYNNEQMFSFVPKAINLQINKNEVMNKMRKMMEKISLYEQGKLENKNLYQDYLRFHQNYSNLESREGVFINLKIVMKIMYDTPLYLCKIQQVENCVLNNDNFCFWESQSQSSNSENDYSNSLVNVKEEDNLKTVLMDGNLYYKIFEKDKIYDETRELKNIKKYNESLIVIRTKIKRNKISKSILRLIEVTFIVILLILYIIILSKKLNLVTQADSIFKTLFYTYYQRAQLLYINSVVLSIHFNYVNLTGMDTLKENKEMLRYLSGNLENGFHLFYKYYLEYKEGLNEDVEELYRQRAINRITINWENDQKMTDYIREMQMVLYMSLESSASNNTDKEDTIDCEYFLLENFVNNTKNNITEVHGNLIRLIYYLYSNYDSVFRIFFEDLTVSFETSFEKFSDNTIMYFLLLETAGLIIYLLFFFINYYFLYQANKYIFQNILCLFLDFTQKGPYSFNNKNDNLLLRQYMRNYISLLTEFTPKKLSELTSASFVDKELTQILSKDETQDTFNTFNQYNESLSIKSEKNYKSEKTRSKSILKKRSSIKLIDNSSKKNIPNLNEKNEKNDKNDIHELNNTNLTKMILRKLTSKNYINSHNFTNKLNKSNITNNITAEKSQNNSSILNINSSIDQSRSSILMNQSRNDITVGGTFGEDELNIEKVILISKPIMIKIIRTILIIFVVLSTIYVVIYVVSIIIGFLIIREIKEIYIDFRVLVNQYNEIIHYWNNMKTLFILPNTNIATDINNIEKYFSSMNTEVLNVLSQRIGNYKRIKILYNYLFNSHTQEELLDADFCGEFQKCFELINSTQNVLINGLNSAVALYEKEIYNFYKDYLKVKNSLKTKEDIKVNFIKDNFIILGLNINHILSHLEEKFFRDFLEDEKDIANRYHIEIKTLSLISLFYCIFLNIYSLLFIFSYINKNIKFVETSTFRIVTSFCHMKKKIQNAFN